MTIYSDKNSRTLLTGSSDAEGDTLTVRRIDGALVTSWPLSVDMTWGSVIVTEEGLVTYSDEGDPSGHPIGGQAFVNGNFTFTLWDGAQESSSHLATVRLHGVNSAPTGQNVTLIYQV